MDNSGNVHFLSVLFILMEDRLQSDAAHSEDAGVTKIKRRSLRRLKSRVLGEVDPKLKVEAQTQILHSK